jgi:hypothetical protein
MPRAGRLARLRRTSLPCSHSAHNRTRGSGHAPFEQQKEILVNGRTILGIVLGVVVVAVLVGVGAGVYNAGISQGIVEAGRVPAGATVPTGYGYGYGYHPGFFGFGFLGLLFPILFIVLLIGIARAAFGGGRRGGWGGGWGPGGHGYGRDGWHEERDRRIADLHQRLHDEQAGPERTDRPGTA